MTEQLNVQRSSDLSVSLVVQLVKNLPAMRETWVGSLGWENPQEKGKATHPSIPGRRWSSGFAGLQWLWGDTPRPRTKEKSQQDGRRGEITLRIKCHSHQRCSEGSDKPCAHQDPETPQKLSQNCAWASHVEAQLSGAVPQDQGLWVQPGWAWHKPSCRRSLLPHHQFSSGSVVSDSLRPHGLQHARPPCPSPIPGVYSNSWPLIQWCHPAISSSVVPFSSHLQSFPASGSFQMSLFFASGGRATTLTHSWRAQTELCVHQDPKEQWPHKRLT